MRNRTLKSALLSSAALVAVAATFTTIGPVAAESIQSSLNQLIKSVNNDAEGKQSAIDPNQLSTKTPIKLEQDPARRKLLLSQLVVNRMENFFIKPSVVEAWSDDKRKFIEMAYELNVKGGVDVGLEPQLMLFP